MDGLPRGQGVLLPKHHHLSDSECDRVDHRGIAPLFYWLSDSECDRVGVMDDLAKIQSHQRAPNTHPNAVGVARAGGV